MDILEPSRLLLVSTPLHVLGERLEHSPFNGTLEINGISKTVHFPAEWPGDALVLFPVLVEKLTENPNAETWDGTLIERSSNVAVG